MTRRLGKFIRLKRDSSGSVAVEFALILPVFMAMIFGIVEFGRMMWIRNSMEMAVEQAARYGAITSGATQATIEAYAATPAVLIGVDPSTVDFNATPCTVNTVTVNATHAFTTVAAYFVPALTSLNLSVTASFAC